MKSTLLNENSQLKCFLHLPYYARALKQKLWHALLPRSHKLLWRTFFAPFLKRPDFDKARRSCSKLQAYWISCNVCVLVCWTGEMGCILQLSKFKKGKSHQAESDTLSKSHIWEMPFFGFAAFSINLATKQLFFRGLWLYGARLCLSPVICYWPPFLLQSTLSGSPQSWKSKRKYVEILIPLFSES